MDSTLSVGVKRQLVGFGWNCRRSPERRNQNTFIIIHKAIKGRRKQRWEEKPWKSLLQCSHTHTHLLKHITTSDTYTHIYKVTEGARVKCVGNIQCLWTCHGKGSQGNPAKHTHTPCTHTTHTSICMHAFMHTHIHTSTMQGVTHISEGIRHCFLSQYTKQSQSSSVSGFNALLFINNKHVPLPVLPKSAWWLNTLFLRAEHLSALDTRRLDTTAHQSLRVGRNMAARCGHHC